MLSANLAGPCLRGTDHPAMCQQRPSEDGPGVAPGQAPRQHLTSCNGQSLEASAEVRLVLIEALLQCDTGFLVTPAVRPDIACRDACARACRLHLACAERQRHTMLMLMSRGRAVPGSDAAVVLTHWAMPDPQVASAYARVCPDPCRRRR